MTNKRPVRNPQQQRGIDKKEKILQTAYKFVCEKGYSKLTTPKIANESGVSIGCFYSYFKDKEDLFLAVLDRYSSQFDKLSSNIFDSLNSGEQLHRSQLKNLILDLIKVHENSKMFQAEINLLYHTVPAIRKRIDQADKKIKSATLVYIHTYQTELCLNDPEASATVITDIITAVVDRIVFGDLKINRKRVIDAGIDALKGLLGPVVED
jgi:AcrR family transcriptional regulator